MMRTGKKIMLTSLLAFSIFVLGGLIFLDHKYQSFEAISNFEINENALDFFNDNYEDSRASFLRSTDSLKGIYVGVQHMQIYVPSSRDTNLYIDAMYIPSASSNKLLILTSGLHGTEGFVGSAMQEVFVKFYLDQELLNNSSVMLIHSLNPYGYKYGRRVTENNIDLNRNSDVDSLLFLSKNEGYASIYSLINPIGKVQESKGFHRWFLWHALSKIAINGMDVLRQAILQGQYEYEKGVYFGGFKQEGQIVELGKIIKAITENYKVILAIDIHSGYGERGKMHLFPNPVSPQVKKRVEYIFQGRDIDWGDEKSFYTVTGSFVDHIGQLSTDKIFIPMLFEFGTLNTQSTFGSLKSIHNTIMENQGTQFGYQSKKDSLKVNNAFREMYYPQADDWKSQSVREFSLVMDDALKRFAEM